MESRGKSKRENLDLTSRIRKRNFSQRNGDAAPPRRHVFRNEVRLRGDCGDRDGHRDPAGKTTGLAGHLPRQGILDFVRQRFLEYPVVYLEQDHDYYVWQEEMRDTWR